MALARATLSQPANVDLDGIWDYLAAEASPAIADFVIARLFEALNRAAENPLMYAQTEYGGRPRRINVFEYAIFYEPSPTGMEFLFGVFCMASGTSQDLSVGRKLRPHADLNDPPFE